MIRLVVLLDLLYDCSKDQTGIWSPISDVIEEMQALGRGTKDVDLVVDARCCANCVNFGPEYDAGQ